MCKGRAESSRGAPTGFLSQMNISGLLLLLVDPVPPLILKKGHKKGRTSECKTRALLERKDGKQGIVFIKHLISFVCFLKNKREEMDGYKKCPQSPLQIHLTDTRGREHSRSFILTIFYGYVLLARVGWGGGEM
jgi:hypothetical protein